MRRFLHNNGLSLTLFFLFIISITGQYLTGWLARNEEFAEHDWPPISAAEYIKDSDFASAVFENWESEFLQMAVYVLLTAWLLQKGSPESKPMEGTEEVDQDPRDRRSDPHAPWPVRHGGPIVLWLYENSLSLAMLGLFVVSFILHAIGSLRRANVDAAMHGAPPGGLLEHFMGARFWFESLQNWQSEFLSTGMLVLLGIVLRQRGSPESKPVAAPHSRTGH